MLINYFPVSACFILFHSLHKEGSKSLAWWKCGNWSGRVSWFLWPRGSARKCQQFVLIVAGSWTASCTWGRLVLNTEMEVTQWVLPSHVVRLPWWWLLLEFCPGGLICWQRNSSLVTFYNLISCPANILPKYRDRISYLS